MVPAINEIKLNDIILRVFGVGLYVFFVKVLHLKLIGVAPFVIG